PDVGDRLVRGLVGRGAVVDLDLARVGDDVARHPARDPYGIEALAEVEAVDGDGLRSVGGELLQDRGGEVDGVLPHPRTCAVRADPAGAHRGAECAVAAALDAAVRGLTE